MLVTDAFTLHMYLQFCKNEMPIKINLSAIKKETLRPSTSDL